MAPHYVWKRIDTDLREAVEPLIERWGWLLPPWLATLHIRPLDGTDGDDNETLADMDIDHYRYREVTLRVSSRILLEKEEDQSKAIVHEYMHACLAPIFTVINKLELVSPLPELLTEAEEQVVEDLVKRIWDNSK
jgi:hypothetical protein